TSTGSTRSTKPPSRSGAKPSTARLRTTTSPWSRASSDTSAATRRPPCWWVRDGSRAAYRDHPHAGPRLPALLGCARRRPIPPPALPRGRPLVLAGATAVLGLPRRRPRVGRAGRDRRGLQLGRHAPALLARPSSAPHDRVGATRRAGRHPDSGHLR